MANNELIIRSAIISNKEKSPQGLLMSGKISHSAHSSDFIFYIIEILTPASTTKIKRAITTTLEKKYNEYAKLTEENFEKILESVNNSLDLQVKDGAKEWVGNLNAVIGYAQGKEIFLAQTGSISGYIFRNNRISEIIGPNKNPKVPLPINTFTDVIYGQLTPKDRIVLGNTELYNHVSLDRLRQLVTESSAYESANELFKFFHRIKCCAVNSVFIEVTPKTEIEPETLPDIPDHYFLDQSTESMAKKLQKITAKASEHFAIFSKKAAKTVARGSKSAFDYSKQRWREDGKPAVAEIAARTKDNLSPKFNSAKPKLAKISSDSKPKFKTQNYQFKLKPHLNFANGLAVLLNIGKTILLPKNRKFLYASLVIIALSVGYRKIKYNNANRDEIRTQTEMADAYNKAKETYKIAKESLAVGKESAAEELKGSLDLAQKAQGYEPNKEKAVALTREIQIAIDSLTKSNRTYDPKPAFVIDEDVDKYILIGSDIYGVTKEGKIYEANITDQESRLVSTLGKEAGMPTGLVYFESAKKLLIATSERKIMAYDLTTKTTAELVVESNIDKWQGIKAIGTFSSNIYVLDSEAGIVWKYTKNGLSFTKGTATLNTEERSIRGSTDLAIDGNIYLLSNSGRVSKFARGAGSDLVLSGMPNGFETISAPARLFADENTNYIFILDKNLNRIIRFNKGGEYVSQYFLDGLAIDDFAANGKTQKLWAISGGSVYEINL